MKKINEYKNVQCCFEIKNMVMNMTGRYKRYE